MSRRFYKSEMYVGVPKGMSCTRLFDYQLRDSKVKYTDKEHWRDFVSDTYRTQRTFDAKI